MKLSQIIAAWENGEIIEQQRSNGDWSEWAVYAEVVKSGNYWNVVIK